MKITVNTKDLDLFTAKLLAIVLGTNSKVDSEEAVNNTLIVFDIDRLSAFEAKQIALIIWTAKTTSARMKYELLKKIEKLVDKKDFDFFMGQIQKIEDDILEIMQNEN